MQSIMIFIHKNYPQSEMYVHLFFNFIIHFSGCYSAKCVCLLIIQTEKMKLLAECMNFPYFPLFPCFLHCTPENGQFNLGKCRRPRFVDSTTKWCPRMVDWLKKDRNLHRATVSWLIYDVIRNHSRTIVPGT